MKRKDFIRTIILTIPAIGTLPQIFVYKDELKDYEFCPEFQAVYDCLHEKPNMKLCIATDKRVRDLKQCGIWDKIDLFIMPEFKNNKHDALMNWKNPE